MKLRVKRAVLTDLTHLNGISYSMVSQDDDGVLVSVTTSNIKAIVKELQTNGWHPVLGL